MKEVKSIDPFFLYCSKYTDNKGEPFGFIDEKGQFTQNYKCSTPFSRIKYGYQQQLKKK